MAKLSDVQQSQNGDAALTNSSLHDGRVITSNEVVVPKSDFIVLKLANRRGKGKIHIDGIDDVINPKTITKENPMGKTERIYLMNGVTSIWQSDLIDILTDKEFVSQNKRSLTFAAGICRIPSWDTNAVEWVKVCRHNIHNKNRKSGSKFEFYIYDPAAEQKDALKREMLELEMAIKAKELEIDELKKVASYLNIGFLDDLAQPKTDDGIRMEVMMRAKNYPEDFQSILSNMHEVEVQFLVKSAIISNKIDLGRGTNAAHWASTGAKICNIPPTESPVNYLTAFAMNNSSEEGKNFMTQLEIVSKN
jgi:hypothetical protein